MALLVRLHIFMLQPYTMLLISHTFYIVLFINNRRGGIVVERSYAGDRGSIPV